MKLLVLSAPLLLASTTFARSPLRRGQATDTCANLNADLVFPDVLVDGELSPPCPCQWLSSDLDGLDKPYDAGRIHVSLCISQVEMFVGHYNVTEAAAKIVGVDKVQSTVTDMVNSCVFSYHILDGLLWLFTDQKRRRTVFLPATCQACRH